YEFRMEYESMGGLLVLHLKYAQAGTDKRMIFAIDDESFQKTTNGTVAKEEFMPLKKSCDDELMMRYAKCQWDTSASKKEDDNETVKSMQGGCMIIESSSDDVSSLLKNTGFSDIVMGEGGDQEV
ncbi:hypothetical protein Tco_1324413, partial [Tanacetum coccineum]